MRTAIIVLFFLLVITMGVGFYLREIDEIVAGDRCIGLSILAAVFILMPMFLYHRWKNRKVHDYMLTEDNIKKMRDFSNKKKTENQ
ncbi:hypothetical protein ACH3O9_06340 [Leeuwenhoekiella sp. A16]|uniref:hypothetical protein n=1 Tax=unclassified Leeuwenhoekiella TaxID=2615029 RepID=UPI003A80A00D|tara:strand:- start:539 stop:796 length:258 start_codon:yes stop_codon:yes gene_type:complete